MLIGFFFFSSCREEENRVVKGRKKSDKIQRIEKNPRIKASNPVLKNTQPRKDVQKVIPPSPCPIDPEPIDPYPIDPGLYPIDLIPPVCPPSPPQTIRDSIVIFPFIQASFGAQPDELLKFIDSKIANSMEWSYLKELGSEGKIYIRLLIDVKGKVREVTFLKFTDKQLEILKNKLNLALLGMPNWSPAKNENGQNVVSEYTFPFRIQFD